MINEVLGYRGIYKQDSNEPYRISRSKIDLFINCPRCFWLETKLGIKQPPGFPFNINSAIDNLFKNEFDYYRQKKEQHPIQKEYKLKGILPYQHDSLDIWRDAFKGVQFLDKKNNLVLFGGVDDIWVDSDGALIVVDYKSTAKKDDITELNADWHIGYKRQLDIYTWLLQKLDFKVSDKAYWVYANGIADEPFFNNIVKFRTTLIEHKVDTSWVQSTIDRLKDCLNLPQMPTFGADCEYCKYVGSRLKLTWQK